MTDSEIKIKVDDVLNRVRRVSIGDLRRGFIKMARVGKDVPFIDLLENAVYFAEMHNAKVLKEGKRRASP